LLVIRCFKYFKRKLKIRTPQERSMYFHFHLCKMPTLRKPTLGIVGIALWLTFISCASAQAEDAAALRARVIQEVLAEVQDVELAKQIVEIRLKREYLNQQVKSKKAGNR
jgi:hypothetical protein